VSETGFARQLTERQVSHGNRLFIVGSWPLELAGAPQQHFDAGHQLAHRERLAQIVVGADLQAENAVEFLLPRCDKDDRNGV
jgi:hypothetical protein